MLYLSRCRRFHAITAGDTPADALRHGEAYVAATYLRHAFCLLHAMPRHAAIDGFHGYADMLPPRHAT